MGKYSLFFIVLFCLEFAFAQTFNSEGKNYYEVLGITKDADPDLIKSTYRGLARKFHPDYVDQSDKKAVAVANEKLKDINEAWDVLRDPKKRAQHDRELNFSSNRKTTGTTTTTTTASSSSSQNNFKAKDAKTEQGSRTKDSSAGEEKKAEYQKQKSSGQHTTGNSSQNGSWQTDQKWSQYSQKTSSKVKDPESLYELIEMEKKLYAAEDVAKLKKSFVDKIKSPEDFLRLMQLHGKMAYRDHLEAVSRLIVDSAEKFMRLNPSVEQVMRLEKLTVEPFASFKVRELAVKRGVNKDDFMRLTDFSGHYSPQQSQYYSDKLITENLADFFKQKPGIEELDEILKRVSSSESLEKIKTVQLKNVRNLRDYIRYANPPSENMTVAAKEAMAKARMATANDFFQLSPTLDQVMEYEKSISNDVELAVELRRRGLKQAKSAADYEKLFKRPNGSQSKEYQQQVDRFIGESFPEYLKTKPSGTAVIDVLEKDVKDVSLRKILTSQSRQHMGMGFCLSVTLNRLLGGM